MLRRKDDALLKSLYALAKTRSLRPSRAEHSVVRVVEPRGRAVALEIRRQELELRAVKEADLVEAKRVLPFALPSTSLAGGTTTESVRTCA